MQTLKRLWAKIRRLKLPGSGGQGGFTLIELLVVVIILRILAGVVTVNVARFAGRGQDSANEAERDNVQLAIDSLMTDNKALTVNTDANARQAFGGGSFNFRTADWPAEPADVPIYPKWIRQETTSMGYCWNDQGEVTKQVDPADTDQSCTTP